MIEKQYKNMLSFFVISFILPLISVFLQTIIHNSLIQLALYGIEAASPSIAALIVLCLSRNVKTFFVENIKAKKIIAAFTLPVITMFITMLFSKFVSCLILKKAFIISDISYKQSVIILWSFIAEEFGWRGYLQPFLKKRMKKEYLVPFVVGVAWGLWHYHYFLFGEMQVPLIWFFVGCVVESYIYNYLLLYTENNLISAMTYHLAGNLFIHIFAINPIDNMGNAVPYMTFVICEFLILIIFSVFDKTIRIKGIRNQ